MRHQSITVDQVIGRLATRAHGIVTRAELIAAGVTPAEIRSRLRSGALLREYDGVYRVGHRAPSTEARYLAAVKACGEGAVLSGRAAAHLLRLVNGPAPRPEVTVSSVRRVRGVRTRRARRIQRTKYRGIPVTPVPQILIDLAPTLALDDLARACHEAGVKHETTPAHVEAILRPNAPGARKLRAVLRGEIPVTLSELERQFLELLREHDLPLPITNRVATERRVDCRWPEHRLTVELDSYRYHRSRHAWEQDRRREREAYARGDQHRRYTYRDVFEDTRQMLAELRTLLR